MLFETLEKMPPITKAYLTNRGFATREIVLSQKIVIAIRFISGINLVGSVFLLGVKKVIKKLSKKSFCTYLLD